MATSLQALRDRIAAADTKSQQNTRPATDNAVYPHWNIDQGAQCVLRFLPDGDSTNSFFWAERQVIKLPFSGIKGQPDSKRFDIQVPCMEMYGDSCPILSEVRPWYKDDTLKDMANKYWKKRSYIFQGFVRTNPLTEEKAPVNPIRRFVISPQIFTIIKSSLMDPELDELPTDYLRGLDFRVIKSTKGDYADYSTSSWARKETPLTEEEQEAIATHKLFNLAEFLPKKPTDVEQRIMQEMFEASVDGKQYDLERWGQYFRPYGVEVPQTSSRSETAPTPKVESKPTKPTPAPWDAAPDMEAEEKAVAAHKAAVSSDKAQDILALIRARKTS